MKKSLKKTLGVVLSLSMIAGTVALPAATAHAAPATWSESAASWKFDFGASDAVADDYIGVSADMSYTADRGYGFLGLENGFSLSGNIDGWEMTQGYDLILEDGKKDTVSTADDDWVATTTRTELEQDYNSPIRFAMKSPETTYYTVKIKLVRADTSDEARVNLFTEKRHQHLLDYPIPEEGLTYTTNVYVHNWWDKNNGEYHNNMLNISAEGDNVAISSIEVTKASTPGKTVFVLTDSTGCEQTASIPYFPLNHCQGVGSALTKYLGPEWALVNEGQSGLSSTSAKSQFNNCINNVKAGDIMWFEFGHNDAKESNGVENYKASMASYYSQVSAKGASFIVVSPCERKMESQYSEATDEEGNKTYSWSKTLSAYADAGKEFVEAQIAAGKTNIAYIDLNDLTIGFLNSVAKEINDKYNYGWVCANFYYNNNDFTHPNDYGADVFAKLALDNAKERAEASDKTASETAQAAVFNQILGTMREGTANKVPESIYSLGKVTNSAYPKALVQRIYYDFPWLLKKVEWNEDGTAKSMTATSVACADETIPYMYAKGEIKIYNEDGTLKGTLHSSNDAMDSTISGEQTVTFTDTSVKFDADAGDTYEAYLVDGADSPTDKTVSNTLTEKDTVDVKEYLIQGSTGTENKEDFSSYSTVATGATLLGTNGWSSQGDVVATLGEDSGKNFMALSKGNSGNTHYLYKALSGDVTEGQLYLSVDLRYHEGTVTLEFTDGSAAPNAFPPARTPLVVKTNSGKAGVYLAGDLVSEIDADDWVTIQYILDLDNASETASVNGKSLTKDVDYLKTFAVPSPAKLRHFAVIETAKASLSYDLTNIVIATLNVDAIPEKTLTVGSADAMQGAASILYNEEVTGDTTYTTAKNTVLTVEATPAKGYEFVSWNDSETGEAISFAQSYMFRLNDDLSIVAEFQKETYNPIEYAWQEPFSTLTTNTLAAAYETKGWSGPNISPTVVSEEGHGNYLNYAPGQQNDRNFKGAFPDDAKLDEDYVFEFDASIKPGTDHSSELTVYGDGVSVPNNATMGTTYKTEKDANGKDVTVVDENGNPVVNAEGKFILYLKNGGANSTEYTINEGTDKVTIPSGAWVHFFLKVHLTEKTVDVKITNGDTVLFSGTEDIKGEAKLGGINYLAGRYQSIFKLDDLKVYTASQLTDETIVYGTPSISDGTITLPVTNYTATAQPVKVLVASYTAEGALDSLSEASQTSIAASEYPGVTKEGVTTNFTASVTTANYKILFWDGLETQKPLRDAIPAPAASQDSPTE